MCGTGWFLVGINVVKNLLIVGEGKRKFRRVAHNDDQIANKQIARPRLFGARNDKEISHPNVSGIRNDIDSWLRLPLSQ